MSNGADPSKVVSGAARKPPNAGKGRVKGVPNKTTLMMKEAIVSVYADLQEEAGGKHKHFLGWARDTPTEFYKLAGKLLPLQVTGEDGEPLACIRVELVGQKPDDGNGS